MISRQLPSKGFRTTLACGASLVAIALSPMAHAQSDVRQESAVYLLRYAQEIADGTQVISQSKDMMMARARVGDRSMLVFDTQNGAITIERGGRTAVLPLVSKRGPETSYTFDYANNSALGNSLAAPIFNVTVRPLLVHSPELGIDARWEVETTLQSLLVAQASDATVALKVSRTYLENDGKPVVLLEFEIPAFTYVARDGSTIVHWARGMAVTDPGFAEIHALATQHRASVQEVDGDMRPVSVRTTMHGIDRAGGWRMSFANAPQIQAAMARVTETQGNSVHLTSASDSSADLPLLVASHLNAVAFGIAENSANGIQLAIGASEVAESIGLPFATTPTPSDSNPASDVIVQALEGALGSIVEFNDRAREQSAMPFSAGITGVTDQATVDAYNRNAAELGSKNGYDPGPPKTIQEVQQILDTMRASGQINLNLGLGTSREDGARSFLPPMSDDQWEAIMNGTAEPPTFPDPSQSAALTELIMTELQSRDDTMAGRLADDVIVQALEGALGSIVEFNDRAREQSAMPMIFGALDEKVVEAYNRNAAELGSKNGYDPGPPKTIQEVQQILDTMRASGQMPTLNLGLGTSREDGARSFLPPMSDDEWEAIMNGTAEPPTFPDPSQSAALTELIRAELQRRQDIIGGRSTDDPTAVLQTINDLMQDGGGGDMTADQLDALVSKMAREAMLEPRLQDDGLGGFVDLPLWIDPESPDADQYRRLVEELRRELEETRKALDGDKDRDATQNDGSGFGDNENFYENNAFEYTSMVGIVATDLGRWAEWLATQNMRELERLADNAGYPNLASALADAQNILRQSQDPGYRQWAMQAPSCNGPAGCGPSYLERWHMKQSIVALGDILADSRDIFSSGGFSDIGISGLDLSYLLRDHALEDGDIIRVRITQFGHVIYEGTVNLTNAGEVFGMLLGRGVASLEIFAVNEGSARPNTAQITVDNVVRGEDTQTYSLATGETATLRIEAGAKPGPAAGSSGAPQ